MSSNNNNDDDKKNLFPDPPHSFEGDDWESLDYHSRGSVWGAHFFAYPVERQQAIDRMEANERRIQKSNKKHAEKRSVALQQFNVVKEQLNLANNFVNSTNATTETTGGVVSQALTATTPSKDRKKNWTYGESNKRKRIYREDGDDGEAQPSPPPAAPPVMYPPPPHYHRHPQYPPPHHYPHHPPMMMMSPLSGGGGPPPFAGSSGVGGGRPPLASGSPRRQPTGTSSSITGSPGHRTSPFVYTNQQASADGRFASPNRPVPAGHRTSPNVSTDQRFGLSPSQHATAGGPFGWIPNHQTAAGHGTASFAATNQQDSSGGLFGSPQPPYRGHASPFAGLQPSSGGRIDERKLPPSANQPPPVPALPTSASAGTFRLEPSSNRSSPTTQRHYSAMKENISLKTELKDLKMANSKLLADNQNLTADIGKLTADNQNHTADIGKLTADNQKLTTDNGKLTADIQNLKTINEKLATDNEKLTADKAKLSTISCGLVEQLEGVLDVLGQVAAGDDDSNVQIDEDDEDDDVVDVAAEEK